MPVKFMLLEKRTFDGKFQICQISLSPTDSVILDHTVLSIIFEICISISWLLFILFHNTKLEKRIKQNVRIKIYLFLIICNSILFIFAARITFKYTGCSIFLNSEKHNEKIKKN
jgi:hypothetical protein